MFGVLQRRGLSWNTGRVGLVQSSVLPMRGILDHFRDVSGRDRKIALADRAWRAHELRLKSFEDLRKLWYVSLREKNMLLSVRHECRKKKTRMPNLQRLGMVKKTMARIKTIINERTREYKTAQGFPPVQKEPRRIKRKSKDRFVPHHVSKSRSPMLTEILRLEDPTKDPSIESLFQ